MFEELLDVTFRAILSLITLFIVTKMIGKKQVSELSLFDYVIGISIGNFAAEMTLNLDVKISHGVLAVIIFGVIAYVISILTMKSIKLRRFFIGVPTIIIEDGNLLDRVQGNQAVPDFHLQCPTGQYADLFHARASA